MGVRLYVLNGDGALSSFAKNLARDTYGDATRFIEEHCKKLFKIERISVAQQKATITFLPESNVKSKIELGLCNERKPPKGTYRDSCKDCEVIEQNGRCTLICNCDGTSTSADLDACGDQFFRNSHGSLLCAHC